MENLKKLQSNPALLLQKAIKEGDLKNCKMLLESGEFLNPSITLIKSPLITAIMHNKPEIVQYFIHAGDLVNKLLNQKDKEQYYNPLFQAILEREKLKHSNPNELEKNLQIIKILLENDADLHVVNSELYTPLEYACLLDQAQVVGLIIKCLKRETDHNQSEKDKDTKLTQEKIPRKNNVNVVLNASLIQKSLLTAARNHKSKGLHDFYIEGQITPDLANQPLLLACSNPLKGENDKIESENLKETVRILLKAGANPNHIDKLTGFYPLHIASKYGLLDACIELISAGANVNCRAGDTFHDTNYHTIFKEDTPLIIASHYGHLKIVELLLEQGADPNLRNSENATALYLAIKEHRTETTSYPIDPAKDYQDPIFGPIYKGLVTNANKQNQGNSKDKIIEALLKAKANPENIHSDIAYSRALFFALIQKKFDLVKIFIKNGANLEGDYLNSGTFFAFSIRMSLSQDAKRADQIKYFEVIQLAIEQGADLTAINFLSSAYQNAFFLLISELENVSLMKSIIDRMNFEIKGFDLLNTALMTACLKGNLELVKLLLEANANPFFTTSKVPHPPVYFAVHSNDPNKELIRVLFEKGILNYFKKPENTDFPKLELNISKHDHPDMPLILLPLYIFHELFKNNKNANVELYYTSSKKIVEIFEELKVKTTGNDECVFRLSLFSKLLPGYSEFCEEYNGRNLKLPLNNRLLINEIRESIDNGQEINKEFILTLIWKYSKEKIAFDKRKKFKDNAEYNRQAQPLVDQLLKMPKRVADLDYIGLLNGIKKAKAEFEALLEENNKINLKPAKKSSKENARQRRKEDNLKKKNQVAQHIQSALELFEKLEPKFRLFNKIFSRTRKKSLEFIENGNLIAAKNRIQFLNDLLEKESKEIQDCGIAILNEKLRFIHTEINILIEICKKNNQEDETIERREETPAEHELVEAKQKEEAERLAQDKKVKNDQEKALEKQLDRAKECIKQTQNRMKASDIAMTRSKKKPKTSELQANETHSQEHSPNSESPENGNSPLRNNKTSQSLRGNDKTKNASSGSSLIKPKAMPNSNTNNLEVKGNAERDSSSDDEEEFTPRLRRPQKSTFASLTELSKKLEVLDDSAQIKIILENPPTLDNEQTRKFESYALLLACAKAMHTIKSIQGEAIFPRPLAEKFRNTIYHCYPLFQALASNKDLKLTIPKSDTNPTEETIHIPAAEMNAQIREMALNLYEYIRLKLTDQKEQNRENEHKQIQELKQEREQPILDPKAILEQRSKEIINAIHSTLFNAILKVKIPVKTENACIEVMNSANLELHAIQKLEKMPKSKRNKIIHPIILKAAKDLIIARLGSFYAYGYDHFASITNDKQYKPYRKFREKGNITRHNDKTNAGTHQNLSTVQMTAENELRPLTLSRTKSQEFPKLSEPMQQEPMQDSKYSEPNSSSNTYISNTLVGSHQSRALELSPNLNPQCYTSKGLILLSNSARRVYDSRSNSNYSTNTLNLNNTPKAPSKDLLDDFLQHELDSFEQPQNFSSAEIPTVKSDLAKSESKRKKTGD